MQLPFLCGKQLTTPGDQRARNIATVLQSSHIFMVTLVRVFFNLSETLLTLSIVFLAVCAIFLLVSIVGALAIIQKVRFSG